MKFIVCPSQKTYVGKDTYDTDDQQCQENKNTNRIDNMQDIYNKEIIQNPSSNGDDSEDERDIAHLNISMDKIFFLITDISGIFF